MRARPNLSGDQLVTDYLTRVAQASRLLPKGARMAFVGRTRAILERELGPGPWAEPQQVMAVLQRLGEPEDLVREERTRIDRGWLRSRAPNKAEGEAAAAALTGPRMNRPLTARRRPKPDTQPLQGRVIPPAPDEPPADLDVPAQAVGPRRPRLRSVGLRAPMLRGPGQRGSGLRSAGAPGTGQGTGSQRALVPRGPRGAIPPDPDAEVTGHITPASWLTGQPPPDGTGQETLAASAGRLARDNVLETIAVLFLGLGGLILPFPFWPAGAIVSLFSRLWDIKDKLVAVTGPLLVTLAVSVVTAVFIGGTGNVILIYFHALRVDFGLIIRVGSVLTAAYLAWRVSRGPRAKVPPWKRIKR